MSTTASGTGLLREQKRRELAEVRRQLGAARERLRRAAIEYAATPDGAAEMFRRYELADDEQYRRVLRATYLAGLAAAAEEYEQRCALGNQTQYDGPLEAIPVGDFADPLARALVEHRVMGSLRNGPSVIESGQVVVWLLRLMPDGRIRKRLRIVCDAEPGVFAPTLAQVVAGALGDPRTRERVVDFVGPEVAAAAAAAEGQRL
ncbi:hypothetical protein H7I87_13320 [Mycobacterium timonense]|uniref:Uncharacterized protein n=2 Tax=Mycobacterium TaxID=1763 RepID=A0AAW5SBR3_MYCBC|nr:MULTISPECIES: hypothetical protein [Mycobacterium]KMV21771.1 hypothetical protein ACT16_14965 [Mycobacterium heckeshornense]MCV6992166.1 hypothetical protein [Mycobacterium bouchedurhonense]MCV6995684.1 hypothetical protein [Mycobacterium timonense]ORA40565.1 hypothetical protein BST19_27805 [Mycobacterium bouchedurhonense]ORW11090.1 hypothetical protein AWC14_19445 [Mycobacterium kyorinense]